MNQLHDQDKDNSKVPQGPQAKAGVCPYTLAPNQHVPACKQLGHWKDKCSLHLGNQQVSKEQSLQSPDPLLSLFSDNEPANSHCYNGRQWLSWWTEGQTILLGLSPLLLWEDSSNCCHRNPHWEKVLPEQNLWNWWTFGQTWIPVHAQMPILVLGWVLLSRLGQLFPLPASFMLKLAAPGLILILCPEKRSGEYIRQKHPETITLRFKNTCFWICR